MRALLVLTLSLGLFVACVPQSSPDASVTPSPPIATSPQTGGAGAQCAPPIPARGSASATLTELPHAIGAIALFGLDGSFVASAYHYPLGAQKRWFELDADRTLMRQFEWRWQGGMLQSPDASKVLYGVATDTTTGRTALFIRDLNGTGRMLSAVHAAPLRWLDADRVLVESYDQPGVIHSVDTRTGADQIVFWPPPPPTRKADGDDDFFYESGDLRRAVFTRWNAAGTLLRQDLFDVARGSYVPGVRLATNAFTLAPVGDVALWLEGNQVRAMRLCDRRAVTLGAVTTSTEADGDRRPPAGHDRRDRQALGLRAPVVTRRALRRAE